MARKKGRSMVGPAEAGPGKVNMTEGGNDLKDGMAKKHGRGAKRMRRRAGRSRY